MMCKGFLGLLLFVVALAAEGTERIDDLRLSVYATVDSTVRLADEQAFRDDTLAVLRNLGITKIYLEAFRSGVTATPAQLETARDFFRANGLLVVGAIATVPGKGVGVASNEGLHWYNFEAPETRQALENVIRQSAPLFDTFIVDDFLCSGDTSDLSQQARGDQTWSQYRRDLMVRVSREVFIGPAKEVNPGIRMIIKYPQWYDLFHVYGYDVARQPGMFDGVWVGTETRGANTQRFGFVQPYEGFVNYRWIAALSGGKIGGAWFDYGDCADFDFLDQAWQSVAAGAPELVMFQLGDVLGGHPDHARLVADFPALADLAACVRANPITGPVGYKPPNSDAGGDLYLMDFIGMLGVSLVPSPVFPSDAATILLPTQAAADADIARKIADALKAGRHVIVTPGFLAKAPNDAGLAEVAGLSGPVTLQPLQAETIPVGLTRERVQHGLDLAADLKVAGAEVLLEAPIGDRNVPFLTSFAVNGGRVSVLNTRTFSQADFDAVGEVLLAPRPLGLMHLPALWADTIRAEFMRGSEWQLRAPARVTCQQLGNTGWIIQNYNNARVEALMQFADPKELKNALTGEPIVVDKSGIKLDLPPRGRLWIKQGQ